MGDGENESSLTLDPASFDRGLLIGGNRCNSEDRPLPACANSGAFSSNFVAGGGTACSPVVPSPVENLLTQRSLPAMFWAILSRVAEGLAQ
jgi:hypothetical protein